MAANPFISNGTCYYEAGEESDPSFIPCGNDALGHKTCCQAGDTCLSSKACFNLEYGITYLAGCSDPDYQDASCPEKRDLGDSPWVGLVTCAGSNLWSACPEDGKPTTLRSADSCTCTQTSGAAFTDATRLTDIASLPTSLGGPVVWQQGYLPTSTTSTSTPSSSSSSSATTSSSSSGASSSISITVPPTAVSSSSSAPTAQPLVEGSPGMSASTKAGIGAGVTLALLAIHAGIAALLFVLRRRKKRAKQTLQHQTVDDQAMESKYAWSPSTVAATRVSELDSRAARPWSMRTELEDTNSSPRSTGVAFDDAEGGSEGHHGVKAFAELQG